MQIPHAQGFRMDLSESRRPQATGETTRSQQVARIVLAAVLFGLGTWTVQSYVPALAWAIVLAIATWPLYQRAQKLWPPGRRNVLVPALFTTAIALLFIVPLGIVAIHAGREAQGFERWLQQVRTTGIPIPDWVGHLPIGSVLAASWWQDNLADPHGSVEILGGLDRGQIVAFSRQLGSLVLHRFVLFGFTLLTLFFLFHDGRRLMEQVLTASRKAFGPSGERVGRQVVTSVRSTVNGLVLVGLGEGALLGVAYAVVGAPRPALFGVLTAAAAIIPFGAPLVFGLAALLLLGQGATTAAIVLFGFGMLVVFVADHAIRPLLIGGSTRLPFLWVLLGVLGGVESWGLLGLFLGPAIMAALILLWREWTDHDSSCEPPC
jgi:predicted PurR-regulated permease PerM